MIDELREKRIITARKMLIMAAAVLLLGVINICSGSVKLSPMEIIRALSAEQGDMNYEIIMNIRLPRMLGALILGGALALAGYFLQTFFSNPIAGPFVLGISSGAKLAVALVMIFFAEKGLAMSSFTMVSAAFLGAGAAMAFVLVLSKGIKKMSVLIICGVMIGYICSAVTDLVVTFADDSNIVNLHNWSLGSFSGFSWSGVRISFIITLLSVAAGFYISKPMSAYQLGEGYAMNFGVNVRALRISLIILSSLLAACVTAYAGPISFVGIAVPHLMRSLFKTNRPLILIPASFLGGAVFCLISDLIARNLFAPTELSISSVTAVFGAPIVISIMLKAERGHT